MIKIVVSLVVPKISTIISIYCMPYISPFYWTLKFCLPYKCMCNTSKQVIIYQFVTRTNYPLKPLAFVLSLENSTASIKKHTTRGKAIKCLYVLTCFFYIKIKEWKRCTCMTRMFSYSYIATYVNVCSDTLPAVNLEKR